jgi:hypothetical protein
LLIIVHKDGAIKFVGDHLHMLEGSITPLQGAITPLFAATAPEIWNDKSKYGGGYIMPFGVLSPKDESEVAKNVDIQEECWRTSEKVVEDVLGSY